jgi:hypothetical protein
MAYLGTQVYLGDTLIQAKGLYLGQFEALINPTSSVELPTNGLAAWFNASTYPNSGSWNAYIGNGTASLAGSTLPAWKADFGGIFNYTTASDSTITGPGPNSINTLTASNYTIFVVGRQSGSASDYHGRMLSAGKSNWLLGTYGGGGAAGATEYNNALWPWRLSSGGFTILSGSIYDTEWRVHTALKNSTTASYYLNGEFIAETTGINPPFDGPDDLGVNKNFGPFNEFNQMDIGDILVYTSSLNSTEIKAVYDVIGVRYGL